jgi:hypothetical protein
MHNATVLSVSLSDEQALVQVRIHYSLPGTWGWQ